MAALMGSMSFAVFSVDKHRTGVAGNSTDNRPALDFFHADKAARVERGENKDVEPGNVVGHN